MAGRETSPERLGCSRNMLVLRSVADIEEDVGLLTGQHVEICGFLGAGEGGAEGALNGFRASLVYFWQTRRGAERDARSGRVLLQNRSFRGQTIQLWRGREDY